MLAASRVRNQESIRVIDHLTDGNPESQLVTIIKADRQLPALSQRRAEAPVVVVPEEFAVTNGNGTDAQIDDILLWSTKRPTGLVGFGV